MTPSATARPARHALVIAACAATLLLALPSSAGAHASLKTTTPRWGAVLAATPRALTLQYDEEVVPRYARVAVITPRELHRALADGRER
jgi:methionine-rich copper-binding protein CopC